MKKASLFAVTASLFAAAAPAMAAGSPATANLSVSASIANACSVTGGTLAFGTLTAGTPASGTSTGVTVTCTKNDSYALVLDNGTHAIAGTRHLANTANTDTIAYALTVPSLSAGTGTAQSIPITGNIAAAAFATASAGTYADTVVITVTP